MINATACILIGGQSKRFGSTKWKVNLGSKSVVEHIWSASSEFKFQYLIGKTKPKNIKKMFCRRQKKYGGPTGLKKCAVYVRKFIFFSI